MFQINVNKINVSSVQDFYQCRFRWWCKWVMNRVPVATAPALDAGRLLHNIFEDAAGGTEISWAASRRCDDFRAAMSLAHPSAHPNALKALQVIEDLKEALPLWQDRFPVERVLECEEPFEYPDMRREDVIWLGRPDRVVVSGRRVWHYQRRGLAASTNFGTYTRLGLRHYHEHLYGEYLEKKYCKPWKKRSRLTYGGTVFDLVRKLKFRTNVGKKNEAVKTATEMFYQQPVAFDMKSGLHKSVMMSLRQHASDMIDARVNWEKFRTIPAPNEKMNGGYSGSSEDPYFKVLIGEITLDDPQFFKDREDTYAIQEAE